VATMNDVAKAANVSIASVSRVINNSGYVSPELRARILHAMEELQYYPNAVARSLATKRTKTLGLLISNVMNPFFTAAVRGIEDIAHAHGYNLILCNTDEDSEKERNYLGVLCSRQVDGLIVTPCEENSEYISALVESGAHVVLLDRTMSNIDADFVGIDNRHAAYVATLHMLSLDNSRIGIVAGSPMVSTGRDRVAGYKQALIERGIHVDGELVKYTDFKEEGGYNKTLELLSMSEPPTAIFATNNLITLGALRAISDLGLSIPEDVALVGFDDIPWGQFVSPPLTTVVQPAYQLGKKAATLLIDRCSGIENGPSKSIIMDTHLEIRGSCGHGVDRMY
jgi:LacI family transcriptional regulator